MCNLLNHSQEQNKKCRVFKAKPFAENSREFTSLRNRFSYFTSSKFDSTNMFLLLLNLTRSNSQKSNPLTYYRNLVNYKPIGKPRHPIVLLNLFLKHVL